MGFGLVRLSGPSDFDSLTGAIEVDQIVRHFLGVEPEMPLGLEKLRGLRLELAFHDLVSTAPKLNQSVFFHVFLVGFVFGEEDVEIDDHVHVHVLFLFDLRFHYNRSLRTAPKDFSEVTVDELSELFFVVDAFGCKIYCRQSHVDIVDFAVDGPPGNDMFSRHVFYPSGIRLSGIMKMLIAKIVQ